MIGTLHRTKLRFQWHSGSIGGTCRCATEVCLIQVVDFFTNILSPIKVQPQSVDMAAASHYNRGSFCQNLLSNPFTSIAVTFQQWLWLSDDTALIKTTIRWSSRCWRCTPSDTWSAPPPPWAAPTAAWSPRSAWSSPWWTRQTAPLYAGPGTWWCVGWLS